MELNIRLKGMKLLDEWSYLDSSELKAGMMRLMGKNNAMRKVQWTLHYRLER